MTIFVLRCYEEHTIIYEIPAFSMKSKEVTYGSGRRQRKLIWKEEKEYCQNVAEKYDCVVNRS